MAKHLSLSTKIQEHIVAFMICVSKVQYVDMTMHVVTIPI